MFRRAARLRPRKSSAGARMMRANTVDRAIALVNSGQYDDMACIFTGSPSGAAASSVTRPAPGNIGINVGVAAPMAFFLFPAGGRQQLLRYAAPVARAVEFFTQTKVDVSAGWASGRAQVLNPCCDGTCKGVADRIHRIYGILRRMRGADRFNPVNPVNPVQNRLWFSHRRLSRGGKMSHIRIGNARAGGAFEFDLRRREAARYGQVLDEMAAAGYEGTDGRLEAHADRARCAGGRTGARHGADPARCVRACRAEETAAHGPGIEAALKVAAAGRYSGAHG